MVGYLFQNYDTIYVRFLATYTCDLSIFVGFLPKYVTIFFSNVHIYAHKKSPYIRYKQACVYGVTESRRIRGTKLYRQQRKPFMYDRAESNFSLNQAMAASISSKVWFLFIALTVVVVVGYPTTDLLESVDCLLTVYAISQMLTETTIDSVRNVRPWLAKHTLISSSDNVKHDLESLLEQIGFSSFLSLARIITFSPPRTRPKPPSLEGFYSIRPFTHKFHVSCFVFSHFNSLPPASLSLLLHFNCGFHGYLTRSHSACINCPSGISLR